MINQILVALDSSEMSAKVFEQGLNLAKLTGAKLMLLHVLSPEEEGSPELVGLLSLEYHGAWSDQSFKRYQEKWELFQQQSLQRLQTFCTQANNASINTEFSQNPGSPSRVICELAKNWNADLIVMGRRGRRRLTELLLGSVSNYVLHHAPCSVYIVH